MADDDLFAGPAVKIGGADESLFAGPAVKIDGTPAAGQTGAAGQTSAAAPPADASKSWAGQLWDRFTAKDPVTEATLRQAYEGSERAGEAYKDVALGAAGQVTGAGEWVWGLHGPAAKGSQWIRGNITHEEGADVGALAPWVLGGEFLGAGKAASLVPKLGEGVEGLAGATQRILSTTGRSALGGGVATGEAALNKPTGKENYGEAVKDKVVSGAKGALGGAVVGGSIGAGLGAGREVAEVFDKATGKYVSKALDKLIEGATGRGSAEQAAARETAAAARAKAGETQAKIEHDTGILKAIEEEHHRVDVEQAQREATIGGRATRRPSAGRAENVADIRARTSAAFRERVRQAQAAAEKAGMDAEQARGFVAEQEHQFVLAKRAAQQITDDIAKQGGGTPEPLDVAGRVQEAAVEIKRGLTEAREKAADFDGVMKREGSNVVDTSNAVAVIDAALGKVANPNTEAALNAVKAQLQTVVGHDANGNPVLASTQALDKAHSALKYARSILAGKESAIQGVNTQNAAVSAEVQTHLGDAAKALQASMESASDGFKQAMKRFAEYSEPLKPFKGKGALAGVVRRDEHKNLSMIRGQVMSEILGKAKQGEPSVSILLQYKPELLADLKEFYRYTLHGPAGLEKGVSAETAREFLEKNQYGLRQTGQEQEARQIYEKLAAAEKTTKVASESLEDARYDLKGKEASAETAEQKLAREKRMSDLAAKREADARAAKPTPPEAQATERTQAAVSRLRVAEAAKKQDIQALRGEMADAVKAGKVSEKLAHDIDLSVNEITREGLTPRESAGKIEKLYTLLEKNGRITPEELKAAKREIDKLKIADISQKAAAQIIKRGVAAAIIYGVGYTYARDLHIGFGFF